MNRKCAIYNRISEEEYVGEQAKVMGKYAFYCRKAVNNVYYIQRNRTQELIDYCRDKLKIEEIQVFIDEMPVNSDTPQFNNMIDRIHNKEFTDILVYQTDILDKTENEKINACKIEIHSLKEV